MDFVLLQAVFLPLLLSPLAYMLGRKFGTNAAMWFTFGLLLYCTIIIIQAAIGGTYEEHYQWTTLFGEFGFLLDGLAAPFAIIIYVLCTILAIYSKPYMIHKFEHLFKEHYHKNNDTSEGQTTAIIESSALRGLSDPIYSLIILLTISLGVPFNTKPTLVASFLNASSDTNPNLYV